MLAAAEVTPSIIEWAPELSAARGHAALPASCLLPEVWRQVGATPTAPAPRCGWGPPTAQGAGCGVQGQQSCAEGGGVRGCAGQWPPRAAPQPDPLAPLSPSAGTPKSIPAQLRSQPSSPMAGKTMWAAPEPWERQFPGGAEHCQLIAQMGATGWHRGISLVGALSTATPPPRWCRQRSPWPSSLSSSPC